MVVSPFRRRLEESALALQKRFGRATLPDTVVVLGSGFKGFEGRLAGAAAMDFAEIPHFPVPTVAGHGAALVVGAVDGGAGGPREIGVLTGRVHMYEGHDASDVVYPIRALAALGVRRFLLTNAAGSVDPTIRPGQVVLVKDQINLTGRNCLIGAEARELGPLFVDMSACFDPTWRAAIRGLDAGHSGHGPATIDGVYAGLLGPTYETPAETAMLRGLGAHVVGMSTVQEVIAAHQLRLRVAVLSFVTNMTGGLGDKLDHADVIALVAGHQARLHALLIQAVGV